MKIFLVLIGLLAAAAAGAASGAFFAPAAPSAPTAASPAPVQVAERDGATDRAFEARIDALSMQIADLQDELGALRASAARTPVEPLEVAAAAPIGAPVPAVQREQILRVIADEKAAEAQKRENERIQREEEQRLQRADRMAQRVGLNEAQERQLADFYLVERNKFEEMRIAARDAVGGDPADMRTAFRDARDWRNGELVRLFGPEVGGQIAEADQDRLRGGMGGGGNGRRGAAGADAGGAPGG